MNEETLKAVAAYDWGKSRAPLLELDREIRKIIGHPDLLAEMEAALVKILDSDAPRGAKRFVCTRLALFGGDRSLPRLSAMLPRANESDMARAALERIPGESADEALRAALPRTEGRTKIGVINSIGVRKDRRAVAQLEELLADSDTQIAAAAAWALGQIGGDEAVAALKQAGASADVKRRAAIAHAQLACADSLRSNGQAAKAEAIYEELRDERMPSAIRRAANSDRQTAKI